MLSESEKLKLKEANLKLLDEFSRVCSNNDIPFFLSSGSCLGAIRHQGMIPWDDDIDVMFFERDAERLASAMKNDLSDGFFYQTCETDPDFNFTNRKLCLNGTTCIRYGAEDRDIHHGIKIDIYPLHDCASNKLVFLWQQCWAMLYFLLLMDRPPLNHGLAVRLVAKAAQGALRKTPLKKIAKKQMDKYVGNDTGFICSFSCGWRNVKEVFPSKVFAPPKYVIFEGRQMPVPNDAHAYLSRFYGDDYMIPPPLCERNSGSHETLFIDFDNSYEIYRGVKYLTRAC